MLLHRIHSSFWRAAAVVMLIAGVLVCVGAAQQKTSSNADESYQQGMADLKRGDVTGARAAFEQAVKLAPDRAEAHNSLGYVLLAQGHVDDAVAQLKTAIRLDPRLLLAHVNLANALIRQRDLAGAEGEAREATRLDGKSAEAHRTLGRVLSFDGKTADATAELAQAVELDPKRADLHDEYGSLLVQGQRNEKAADEFAEAVRLAPQFGQAKLHLGVVRWQQQQLDEAQKLLERAAQLCRTPRHTFSWEDCLSSVESATSSARVSGGGEAESGLRGSANASRFHAATAERCGWRVARVPARGGTSTRQCGRAQQPRACDGAGWAGRAICGGVSVRVAVAP